MTSFKYGKFVFNLYRLFVVLFLLAPISMMVLITLQPTQFVAGFPSYFSLRWYYAFAQSSFFIKGLTTSLELASVTAVLSTLVGALTARALVVYSFRGREVLANLFISPLIIPEVATGIALLTLFHSIGSTSIFTNLAIGHLIIAMPYSVRSFIAVQQGIDQRYEEASLSLGASGLQTFVHVVAPLLRPAIVASLIFSFGISLNDYAVSVFLSGGTYTFSVALFSYLRGSFDPSLAVGSALLMVVTLLMVYIIDKSVGLDRTVGLTVAKV